MQIVRLVTITFGRLSDAWTKWEAEIDGLKVSTLGHQAKDNTSLLLVKSQTDVTSLLRVNESNEIVIPPEIITRLDLAIESAVNLVSVFEHSKRAISSPMPPVAFIPENDEERNWLDSTQGFNPLGTPIIGVRFKLDSSLQTFVQDRFDGVALLAEANAQEHPAGAFHELIRVFERAFALSSAALVAPLGNFLEDSHQGYTMAEVQKWLVDIRHPATHADRRDYFVAERGIRPVVRRMTQAAYDVLLNKLEWRSQSVSRRDVWKPEGGTAVPLGSEVCLTGKTPANFEATIMDAFNSYPVNTDVGITNFLQKHWWIKLSRTRSKGAVTANGS
jgi:hypothetical protein